MSYTKANKLIKEMSNEQLICTWDAICNGGLGDSEIVNSIPANVWIDLIYSAVSSRIKQRLSFSHT